MSSLHPPAPPRWRLLRTPPLDGATNMALDELLMRRGARSGEWVLRCYSWSRPTLSLGRNQQARDRYDLQAIAARHIDLVRRPTGGRAILHDREVTYSVTGPTTTAGSLGEAYRRINRLLVRGLSRLGVPVEAAAVSVRHLPPGSSPCFDQPAAGELLHEGRKLAGSAQWRDGGALLQHGSILLEGDQSLVATLLADPLPLPPPPATLARALDRVPTVDEVATALEEAVRELEDPAALPLEWDADLRTAAEAHAGSYRSEEWTWRR